MDVSRWGSGARVDGEAGPGAEGFAGEGRVARERDGGVGDRSLRGGRRDRRASGMAGRDAPTGAAERDDEEDVEARRIAHGVSVVPTQRVPGHYTVAGL
jgi:hypothetical protein